MKSSAKATETYCWPQSPNFKLLTCPCFEIVDKRVLRREKSNCTQNTRLLSTYDFWGSLRTSKIKCRGRQSFFDNQEDPSKICKPNRNLWLARIRASRKSELTTVTKTYITRISLTPTRNYSHGNLEICTQDNFQIFKLKCYSIALTSTNTK